MKLSEMNKKCDGLKAKREDLWTELNELVANKKISVGDREKREATLRNRIVDLNEQIFPMEMERAEIDRVTKGKDRKREESWLDEEITLG